MNTVIGIKLYESIQNIDYNEDGSINRNTLKFGMSDSLFRGTNFEELYEIVVDKILDCTDGDPMAHPYKVDKNLHTWNSDKYPYGKSFSRMHTPASNGFMDAGVYIEFDKNELSKIRNVIFRNTNYDGRDDVQSYRDFESASSKHFLAETILLSKNEIIHIDNLNIKKLIKKVNFFMYAIKSYIKSRADYLGQNELDLITKFEDLIEILREYNIPFYIDNKTKIAQLRKVKKFDGNNSLLSKSNLKTPSLEEIDNMYQESDYF